MTSSHTKSLPKFNLFEVTLSFQ